MKKLNKLYGNVFAGKCAVPHNRELADFEVMERMGLAGYAGLQTRAYFSGTYEREGRRLRATARRLIGRS